LRKQGANDRYQGGNILKRTKKNRGTGEKIMEEEGRKKENHRCSSSPLPLRRLHRKQT